MADYRNTSGIVLDEGDRGAVLTLEDIVADGPVAGGPGRSGSPRSAREVLDEFARRDTAFGGG